MREWIAKRGWLRLAQIPMLLVLMAAVHGICFLRVHIPFEWTGFTESTVYAVVFPGAGMLTWLYLLQMLLILVRHRVPDVAALICGAFTCLWTVFPEFPLEVYFPSTGGLGSYEISEQVLGYLVAGMSVLSLMLSAYAYQKQTRKPSANDGFWPLLHTHNGRLRLLAIGLTLLIIWGSSGDCYLIRTYFGLLDDGRAPIIAFKSFSEGESYIFSCLLWLQLLLLVGNRGIWMTLAGTFSGLTLWGYMIPATGYSWTSKYEVYCSITVFGWGVIGLCVLNGAICLLLAERYFAE